jgi:hypothetical protein
MMRNFQFVLDLSKAPLFMWAAQDDLWDVRFIEVTKAKLDTDPSAIGAITGILVTEEYSDGRRLEEVVRMRLHASHDLVQRLLAVSQEGPNAIYALFRTSVVRDIDVDLPIFGPDRAIVFQALTHGHIAFVEDVLRTQPRVGYESIKMGGRLVPRKATGPEGYLHAPHPWPMCRIMLTAVWRTDLSNADKIRVGIDVLVNQWWRTLRNGWLLDSSYRIHKSITEHQYARALLLAGRHLLLAPSVVTRRISSASRHNHRVQP